MAVRRLQPLAGKGVLGFKAGDPWPKLLESVARRIHGDSVPVAQFGHVPPLTGVNFEQNFGDFRVQNSRVCRRSLVSESEFRIWNFSNMACRSSSGFGGQGSSFFCRNLAVGIHESAGELEEGGGGAEEDDDSADGNLKKVKDVEDLKHVLAEETNQYLILSARAQKQYLAEGLPVGLANEFEATGVGSLLVRQFTKDLIGRIETVLASVKESGTGNGEAEGEKPAEDERTDPSDVRRHFLLEGLRGSGKSVALATTVLWARANGWLVFYVPSAREWTQGGLFYRHQSLWDTPLQARKVLEGFLESHEKLLAKLPVQIKEPLSLGEGPGTGPPRGAQEILPEEGWSLRELVHLGATNWHVAVSVVVRLRSELARVTEIPVMVAIDEYNSWFTFSRFGETTGERSRRLIHARELRMVNAFRPMAGENVENFANGMVVAAMSESVGVPRFDHKMPGLPRRVRFQVPRYNKEEAIAAMHFYRSLMKAKREVPEVEEMKKLFFLTNGNGIEIRKLKHFIL